MLYFVPQKQILGDLKSNLAIEMSQNNTLTHVKLQRCQTQRRNTQITAEIMQTYDLLKFALARSNGSSFLLITQYEMPFINKSEATKRSKDRKINGKYTNGTNPRSRVWPVRFIYITEIRQHTYRGLCEFLDSPVTSF